MLLPLAIIALLGFSCKKESLRPENVDLPGVSAEQLQASPKELEEVRSNEALLNKEVLIIFKAETNKPAAGLLPIDWKVDYAGKKTIEDISKAHTYLVDYILDLQDFLEEYPVESYYFLGIHKEFITKLQLALVLKQNLETGIEKLNNAELEKARYQMLQKIFEDMDIALSDFGMTFKVSEDSIEPIVDIGRSKRKAKALRRQLKLYIADGEDVLIEANSEFSILEAGKIEVAKAVLQKINDRLDKAFSEATETYLDKEFEFIN